MNATVDKQEQYAVLTLNEPKLSSLLSPAMKSELVVLNNEGIKNIILDLSSVNFIDSSGLSAILVGNRMCKNAGGSFILTGLGDNVIKLLKISQLDNILNIFPTKTEAIDFVLMEEVERDISDDE
ncbi:MAG: STAS domain-containing protein [Bacteroidetes bacterium]|nr:STAS domain-containing protein [Bacteroidota bacterium]